MRKYSLLVIALVLVLSLLAACDGGGAFSGSGNVVDHHVEARDFERVAAGAAFKVDIRQGESYRVVIRIDDNLVERLDVHVRGGTLHIGFKPGFWITNATRMEAEITMPTLTGVELSGASHGTITGFKSSRDFRADISGASSLKGDLEAGNVTLGVSGASSIEGDLVAGNVSLNVSGASKVTLVGSGGNLNAEASGASHANLESLPVRDVSVEVSGASSATVRPSGRLDVEASGASRVYYLGEPRLGTVNTSGGSSIGRK